MDPFEDVRISAGVILRLASYEDFVLRKVEEDTTKMNGEASQSNSAIVLAGIGQSSDSHKRQSSNSKPSPSMTPLRLLLDFIDRGQDLSKRTGRADYADGVARSYEILFALSPSMEARLALVDDLVTQLEMKIGIAEEDLGQAVLEAPIHSNFAALKYASNLEFEIMLISV